MARAWSFSRAGSLKQVTLPLSRCVWESCTSFLVMISPLLASSLHLLLADLSVWQILSQLFILASCEPAKLGVISAARSSFETASLLPFDMALQNLRKSPVSAGSACRFWVVEGFPGNGQSRAAVWLGVSLSAGRFSPSHWRFEIFELEVSQVDTVLSKLLILRKWTVLSVSRHISVSEIFICASEWWWKRICVMAASLQWLHRDMLENETPFSSLGLTRFVVNQAGVYR